MVQRPRRMLYFNNVRVHESERVCNWRDRDRDSNNKVTGARLTYMDNHMSITISIYTTTGTICLEGSNTYLRRWFTQHYPVLAKVYERLANTSTDHVNYTPKSKDLQAHIWRLTTSRFEILAFSLFSILMYHHTLQQSLNIH